jgi:hypothetical protein
VLLDHEQSKLVGNFKELAISEIFNLFNNQNAITNTYVRDVYSKMNMRFQIYDERVLMLLSAGCKKSSAITFRQASVLLLKVV